MLRNRQRGWGNCRRLSAHEALELVTAASPSVPAPERVWRTTHVEPACEMCDRESVNFSRYSGSRWCEAGSHGHVCGLWG